jgi:N-acetylglucosamine-6-phosphate deacetylase
LDTVVTAPGALIDGEIVGPTEVRIRAGRIADVRPARVGSAGRGLLTPGLVDIQVNGAVGVDFAEVTDDAMRLVAGWLPSTGVTRFLPTLITAPVPVLLTQAKSLAVAAGAVTSGAVPLGVHLEGPFLSSVRHGVHDPALMADPELAAVERILAEVPGLRMMTLAPERTGALAAVRRLVDAGVLVAVGHTDATAAQTKAAADAGATLVTHLFNAQRGLGHREPGVPGVGLIDGRFTLGLIGDLAHVAPDVCRLVFQAAGSRVALVTDAVAAAGMPPGRYQLSGADVLLTGEGVPRSPAGTIAGSALTLDRAVRNMVSIGVPVARALTAATATPAAAIREPALGRLAVGAVGDLVLWDEQLRPRKVWIDGESVFDAEAAAAESAASADSASEEVSVVADAIALPTH